MDKWKKLAKQLEGVFGQASILADGYEVSFYKKVGDGDKLVIETFVNHQFKGIWTRNIGTEPEHPEGRFFYPVKRAAWPKSKYPELKKVFGRKEADELVTPKVIMFSPVWGSARTLIAHLKRNFPDLELIDDQAKQSA